MKNGEIITLRVSEEKKREFEAYAECMGITLSALVKLAVSEYIANKNK